MGDCAFARARAAGIFATETSQARVKAEADIALSLPAEYRNEKNDTRAEYNRHSAQPQPGVGGETDAHAPTPPEARDFNALSAI